MNNNNIILMTDSYKVSHWKQYPPMTEKVSSYFSSRGGKFRDVVFFGLQYFINTYLKGRVVTQDFIDEAQEYFDAHLGPGMFNRAGWELILKKHAGYLPVKIKAVPEGTVVPTGNVLITIENTDPEAWWLTNYLETLAVQTWYPCTVATISREMKKMILGYLEETGDPSLIPFKLHDFGFRGVSSVESAGIGGCAHLVNFMGTDTIAALKVAKEHYNCDMAGFSIPAAEHSTITSWGREHEFDAFENMLDKWPEGLVAVVSDSYNIYKACREGWGMKLREKVLAREGTLVVRPDSGHPPTVVCEVLNLLGTAFGYEENAKGYNVLPPQIRVIQGDGIDYDSTPAILDEMKKNGWSADNIAFGMGGGLLQQCNRDTQEFAFKCSSVVVNGEQRDVYKDPVTDSGKTSMAGELKLVRIEGAHGSVWHTEKIGESNRENQLVTVFDAGHIFNQQSLEEIRERANV